MTPLEREKSPCKRVLTTFVWRGLEWRKREGEARWSDGGYNKLRYKGGGGVLTAQEKKVEKGNKTILLWEKKTSKELIWEKGLKDTKLKILNYIKPCKGPSKNNFKLNLFLFNIIKC